MSGKWGQKTRPCLPQSEPTFQCSFRIVLLVEVEVQSLLINAEVVGFGKDVQNWIHEGWKERALVVVSLFNHTLLQPFAYLLSVSLFARELRCDRCQDGHDYNSGQWRFNQSPPCL